MAIAALAQLEDSVKAREPRLAYAEGVLALHRQDLTAAVRWLTFAQGRADSSAPELVARIAFELGYAYLSRSQLVAASTVVAWAEALLGNDNREAADVLHLRALIADRLGRSAEASELYRRAIAESRHALTPATRVMAMGNLAVAVNHRVPADSVSLCAMAITTVEAAGLNAALVPAFRNIEGYALLCTGDLERARAALLVCHAGAEKAENRIISQFARFNLAIVDELAGDLRRAQERLEELHAAIRAGDADELLGWVSVRLAWLELKQNRVDAALSRLDVAFGEHLPSVFRPGVEMLRALISIAQGRIDVARADLTMLGADATKRGDDLTAFVTQLWLAHLERTVGRSASARRALSKAHALGHSRAFRVSPNWWSDELVTTAQDLAPTDMREFFSALVRTGAGQLVEARKDVHVAPDGEIHLDGNRVSETIWRQGRTGSHVLRRYFGLLAAAHPLRLRREELCDLLWPDSDGDRATLNLYAATNDLRRALGAAPGLFVRAADGYVWLEAETHVSFQPAEVSTLR